MIPCKNTYTQEINSGLKRDNRNNKSFCLFKQLIDGHADKNVPVLMQEDEGTRHIVREASTGFIYHLTRITE